MDICKTFPISLKQGSMPKGHETNYDAATFLFISVWLVFRPNAAGLVNTRHKYNWTCFVEEFTNLFINTICCFLGFNRCIVNSDAYPTSILLQVILFKLQCCYPLLKFQNSHIKLLSLLVHNFFTSSKFMYN